MYPFVLNIFRFPRFSFRDYSVDYRENELNEDPPLILVHQFVIVFSADRQI